MKIMNKNKFVYAILSGVLLLCTVACKDQLNVGNPNAPSFSVNVTNEAGITAFAQGGTYLNGFKNGNDWLGNSYFSLPWGYSEIMADNVGASASNNQITTMGQPDYIILDNGTKVTNNSPQVGIIRSYNTRAATGAGNNALYYQWLTMYALNNAQNATLNKLDAIKFDGDATSKANTIKAWCYWWKGYAYAAIGSMYVSGLIMDEYDPVFNVSKTNADYVPNSAVIARSNYYYNQALTTLAAITSSADYTTVLGELIPEGNKVGNGGVLSIAEWTRNINTMLARNILVNKLSPFVNNNLSAVISKSSTTPISSADWTSIINLTTNGVKKGDHIFTARSTATNSIFSTQTGTVASLTSGKPSASTFKPGERFIANYRGVSKTGSITSAGPHIKSKFVLGAGTLFTTELSLGDIIKTATGRVIGAVDSILSDTKLRLTVNSLDSIAAPIAYVRADNRQSNNFTPSAGYKGDYIYTTVNSMVPEGHGKAGVQVLASQTVGVYEVVMAGSYEENALMQAEALIRTGSIDAGAALIDAVRTYLGAGLNALPTGMTQLAAMQELVSERRLALVFRGLSYYDNRRWGWSYSIANGGGAYNQYVIFGGTVNTNVTINYNFMDYWDVPADEAVLNPPSSSAAPVQNPNY
jgi:hypothetical protein